MLQPSEYICEHICSLSVSPCCDCCVIAVVFASPWCWVTMPGTLCPPVLEKLHHSLTTPPPWGWRERAFKKAGFLQLCRFLLSAEHCIRREVSACKKQFRFHSHGFGLPGTLGLCITLVLSNFYLTVVSSLHFLAIAFPGIVYFILLLGR